VCAQRVELLERGDGGVVMDRGKETTMTWFTRKRGERQAPLPGTGAAPSVRQITVFFAVVAVAFVLYPMGAWGAISSPQVFVTDPINNAHKAHVDADGNLHVAGDLNVANSPTVKAQQDGTWNVGITGTPSVDVENFPATQEVNVAGGSVNAIPPVTSASELASFTVAAGDIGVQDVTPIDASLITVVGGSDDEVVVEFEGTVGGGTDFEIGDPDADLGPLVTLPLPQPIHVEHILARCHNESEDCELTVFLVGS
jgi:hypothetical protein